MAVTVALLRGFPEQPVSIALVERSGSFGRGIAYSTPDPQHLLNVPAGDMSAVTGQPNHLLEWTQRRGLDVTAATYLPRRVYGDYLEEILATTADGRVRHEADEAVGLEGGDVVTRTGRRLEADAVVLAVGISAPAGPSPMAAIEHHPGYVANPWDYDAVMTLAAGRRVLIVGTGLTMIDVALSLSAAGGGPEMLAISSHGELPRAHRPGASEPGEPAVRPGEHRTIAALAAQIQERARAAGDWRAVIDSLRPVTQQLWCELPLPEKQSFLEHYSRRWEVHRSRIAPEIDAQVGALRTAGRLRVAAATVKDVAPAGARISVRLAGEQLLVDGIVNASGPAWDCRRGDNALVRELLAAGLATPGPLGLGLGTTADGALIDRDGRASDRLFTLGALRRGELWETVAVPEIRDQATALADRITAADRGARPLLMPDDRIRR